MGESLPGHDRQIVPNGVTAMSGATAPHVTGQNSLQEGRESWIQPAKHNFFECLVRRLDTTTGTTAQSQDLANVDCNELLL